MKNVNRFLVKIILASSLLYFVIWFIFLLNGPFYVGNGLEKRDWLSFLSGFLSLTGTILITTVVIIQSRRYQEMDNERLRFQNIPNLKINKPDLFSELKYLTLKDLKERTLNPSHKDLLNKSNLSDTELVSVIDNCPIIIWENGGFIIKGEENSQSIILYKDANFRAIYSAENYGIGTAINVELTVKANIEDVGKIYDFGGIHLKQGEKVNFEIMLSSLAAEIDKDIIIEFSFCDIFGNKYSQKSVFNMKVIDTKFEFSLKQKDREPIYEK